MGSTMTTKPIRRIAIVNRGEAALRFIRAAKEYAAERGVALETLALVTWPDRRAPFVREADHSIELPSQPGGGAAAYLDHGLVMAAIRLGGADAVWVGWGFLAEDASFAERCEAEGLTFLGPSSAAMRLAGDKVEAKRVAESAGVPVVPWSGAPLEDLGEARAVAERIGFPLMLKAAAGGGGRGIRIVRAPGDLEEAWTSATREAVRAFGDGRVFLERCIERARHLEVQVAVDERGETRAWGVRDCTVQRRHQKVLEECPGPVVTAEQVVELERWATSFAAAAGYRGVGTVEFIVDLAGGGAYFMEMNARLQVEHPVTEMVYGVDLCKVQIDIARGLPAPPVLAPRGAAIEVRLNAENPEEGFAPSPGDVTRFKPPAGPGIRVDSGVAQGSTIPVDFDSNVAKIIAWGATRDEALARMARALDETVVLIEGGATNRGLLAELIAHPAVRSGDIHTRWLDEQPSGAPPSVEALQAAAALVYREEGRQVLANFNAAVARGIPQRAPDADGRPVRVGGGDPLMVHCVGYGQYRVNGVRVAVQEDEPGVGQLVIDGRRLRLIHQEEATALRVELDGRSHRIRRDTGGVVRAPAPGMVMDVAVRPGDVVAEGDRLLSLEAMKMEMPVLAPRGGRVGEVLVQPNRQVPAGDPLVVLESDDAEAAAGPAAGVTVPTRSVPLDDVTSVAAEVLRILLGYDLDEELAVRVRAALDDTSTPRGAEWATLGSTLAAFVDVQRLFATDLEGPTRRSNRMAFYAFYRQPSGEHPPKVVEALRRAVRHYGLDSLDPAPRLRHALARLAVAHNRTEARHHVVSSVLRLLLRLHREGVDFHHEAALSEVLAEIPRRASARWPFVGDNAERTRYELYHAPPREAPVLERLAAGRIDELVATRHSVFGELARASASSALAPAAALALYRRIYHAPASEARMWREAGVQVVELFRGDPERRALGLVAGSGRLDEVFAELEAHLDGGPTRVDLLVHPRDGESDADVLAAVTAGLNRSARPGLERLTLMVAGSASLLPHHTLVPGDGGPFAEDERLLNLHPEMAAELQLWRFRDFELTRVPCHDRLVTYHALARSNPKDERIFVLALVRDVPESALGGDTMALLGFEHAFHEAMRALRDIQARRDRRQRLLQNQLIFHVRPTVPLNAAAVERVAARLGPHTFGVGLERVVVRARLPRPREGSRDVELHFTNPTGHQLQLEWKAPSPDPIPAATAHELRARKALALGVAHPWEVLSILTGAQRNVAMNGASSLPPGRFQEYDLDAAGRAAPIDRPEGENTAGVLMGVITHETPKHPEGMARVLLLSDPLRAMGALAEPECARIIAALDLAEERGLPVEWLTTSAGALISMDSGTENLDWTARALRRIIEFTARGGAIHVLVDAVNVGAQSYFNAEATMLAHTRGVLIMTPRGSMVLTGKRALDVSGGVSAEDERGIGGYERVMGPNGQAQYYARDLVEAFTILLEHHSYSYVAPGESAPRAFPTADPADRDVTLLPYPCEGFTHIGGLFDPAQNRERKKPFDMRALMAATVDSDGGTLERWADMADAETAIVWDAHLGGHAVTLVGIESQPVPRRGWVPGDGPDTFSGGTLYPRSSKKVARAIRAASAVRPVVVLANLSGFDGSPESMRQLQLEYGAEIGRAVVEFEGRIVFCVVARYHGGAYVVFSKALNPNLVSLAVEGSYASVIGGAPAAAVVFPREVRARTEADPRVIAARNAQRAAPRADRPRLAEALAETRATVLAEKQGEVATEFDTVHCVERARDVGSLDDVIPAQSLRPRLIEALDVTRSSRVTGAGAPRGITPKSP